MIPCIENSCLVYPVCRHKKYIVCEEIFKAFPKNECDYEKFWQEHIKPNFPHALEISEAPIGRSAMEVGLAIKEYEWKE